MVKIYEAAWVEQPENPYDDDPILRNAFAHFKEDIKVRETFKIAIYPVDIKTVLSTKLNDYVVIQLDNMMAYYIKSSIEDIVADIAFANESIE